MAESGIEGGSSIGLRGEIIQYLNRGTPLSEEAKSNAKTLQATYATLTGDKKLKLNQPLRLTTMPGYISAKARSTSKEFIEGLDLDERRRLRFELLGLALEKALNPKKVDQATLEARDAFSEDRARSGKVDWGQVAQMRERGGLKR